jgi:hypothetical protein
MDKSSENSRDLFDSSESYSQAGVTRVDHGKERNTASIKATLIPGGLLSGNGICCQVCVRYVAISRIIVIRLDKCVRFFHNIINLVAVDGMQFVLSKSIAERKYILELST